MQWMIKVRGRDLMLILLQATVVLNLTCGSTEPIDSNTNNIQKCVCNHLFFLLSNIPELILS